MNFFYHAVLRHFMPVEELGGPADAMEELTPAQRRALSALESVRRSINNGEATVRRIKAGQSTIDWSFYCAKAGRSTRGRKPKRYQNQQHARESRAQPPRRSRAMPANTRVHK